MCDRMHFDDLEHKVEEVKDSVAEVKTDMTAYHNRTDERLKTLFSSVERLYASLDRLSASATSLVRVLIASLIFIVTVSVFALVYGAVGQQGFNAVTRAAASAPASQR